MNLGKAWEEIAPGCIVEGVPTLACIPAVFQNIVIAAVVFAGIVALILVVISGIKLITSSGDPKQVEGARATLTWAIIGLILVLLSFFIIRIIGAMTGAECINVFGFTNCQ